MTFDIVLTGMGALSPWGQREAFLGALGRQPAGPAQAVEVPAPPAGGLIDHLGIKSSKLRIARYMDPVSKNAIVAVEEAMAEAGIAPAAVAADPYGFGIVFGATRGPALTREKAYEQLRGRDGKLLSSTLFSNFGYNIAGAMVAIAHGIKGPNLTVAGRRNLSIHVFRRVRQLLHTGKAHTVFAGFTECLPEPEVPGGLREWACALCLERADRASGRGARGPALDELELRRYEAPAGLAPGRALRLPRPLPRPLAATALAAASPLDLDLRDRAGVGPEHLPLVQAGRIKAMESREELGDVAFAVDTRSGLSLVALASS